MIAPPTIGEFAAAAEAALGAVKPKRKPVAAPGRPGRKKMTTVLAPGIGNGAMK